MREHQSLIDADNLRFESYHALFDLYRRNDRLDEAQGVAATLCFLEQATPQEEAFAAQFHAPGMEMARYRLSEDVLRRHVCHPDQDPYVSAVLGLIAPAVAVWRATELPPSLSRKARIDVTRDQLLISRMTEYVTDVLDVDRPELYLRAKEPGDLAMLNVKSDGRLYPSVVVFQNLLLCKTERQVAFALGRYLMDLYPPHFCFVALDRSVQAVKQVFKACLHRVGLPVEGDRRALDQIAHEVFSRMQPRARDQLCVVLTKMVARGRSIDVEQWVAAAELTACRVGLLLAGDLRDASTMISCEAAPLGVSAMLSPRDELDELVLYSISEDYFAARRALGLAVEGRQAA
ncbi:hypothetical protein [Paraliomyxa miuraensis]|uniref:hypothetical protein n=1 Tax=Paraliomyxa miuraensis TaxID=376150 RepID=UPI00225328D0|nr:hypothetical protein [Paraliomyxa miuraensis]MCX4246406.1 hypothetical protein [Paraliomyxa miuraensis]